MDRATVGVMLIALSLVVALTPMTAESAPPTLSISIPGEAEAFESGRPVMVSGIWHYLNVSFVALPAWAEIEMHWEVQPPTTKDLGNYYKWSWDGSNWEDHYSEMELIVPSKCSALTSGIVSFYVGMNLSAYESVWMANITSDMGSSLLEVVVEAPDTHPEVSSADFTFSANAEEAVTIDSADSSQDLRVRNVNTNLPLHVEMDFGAFDPYFQATNMTSGIFHTGEQRTVDLILTTNSSWKSMLVGVDAYVVLRYPYIVGGQESYLFTQVWQVSVNITLRIGHGGYEWTRIGSVLFQFKDYYAVEYQSSTTIDLYLTGYGGVILTSYPSDIEIVEMSLDGIPATQPLSLTLQGVEKHVEITVLASESNVTALLNHELKVDGETTPHWVTIEVGPSADEGDGGPAFSGNIAVILFIAAVVCVFAVLLVIKLMKKRGGSP